MRLQHRLRMYWLRFCAFFTASRDLIRLRIEMNQRIEDLRLELNSFFTCHVDAHFRTGEHLVVLIGPPPRDVVHIIPVTADHFLDLMEQLKPMRNAKMGYFAAMPGMKGWWKDVAKARRFRL